MASDWILRVGDGENLIASSKYRIWGVQSTISHTKYFMNHVKPGDRLWFVKSKTHGKIMAVATYRSHNKREIGPLVNLNMTTEELGWTGEGTEWKSDTEVHYTDLYGLNDCDLLTHIKCPTAIRRYDEKCKVELPVEYNYIVRYSKVTLSL